MGRAYFNSSVTARASGLRRLLAASLCAIVLTTGATRPAKSENRPPLPQIACCSQERADLRLYLRTQEITGRFVPPTLVFRSLALSSTPRPGLTGLEGQGLQRAGRREIKLPQIKRHPHIGTSAPVLQGVPRQTTAVRSDLALEISRDRLRLRLSTEPVLRYQHRPRPHRYQPQTGYNRMPSRAGHPRLPPIGNGLGRLR